MFTEEKMGETDSYQSIAEFYDHVVPYSERQDVAFFVEMAQQSGGPVLEIGCGTGRVLIPTARTGVEIVGLDASPAMLDICKQRLSGEPDNVRAKVLQLAEGDMRRFDLGRQFALVTIPFRPFQHLVTVDDQLACLSTIRRHLSDGGRLILDIFNPLLTALTNEAGIGVEISEEQEFALPDGRRVMRKFCITARDLFNQVQDLELIYYVTHPDGREERLVQAFPMRYLFRFEAEHMLAHAGFAVEHLYADYDKSPYGSKYPGELIFVAHKA
jgi:SAM-dependent methyltransferase